MGGVFGKIAYWTILAQLDTWMVKQSNTSVW